MKQANVEHHRGHGENAGNPAHYTASEPTVRLYDEEWLLRIAVSAYYKAEARGFAPGRELEDWLAAEIEEKSWYPR